ncbi:hypothetical protein BST81_09060 [Leptolyngbya sp. 'hensonii']|uniref:serine/threonine protein kinase n=1 Tax=Leptolyngbya sp. 'hensonii' TaxID=1922337 RepID=UPI00094F9379|nr:protein kinase [Leptolyngbya sp. 'hensonii']OLP18722.1 hypothetical protein BST81_09060 [Leptolyngbya sp. 'hensonii']
MSDFPNFSENGYQVEKKLGHNAAGGRVTYLATALRTQEQVVIKQFQFAKVQSTWTDYNAYEQEIQVLRELNHPGIPRYLDSFPTDSGFCMVQEYKPAVSLGVPRSFSPEQIHQLAISVLEILVYLQNRLPSVIHRDIKPENILVGPHMEVYLIDFGFARIGHGEVGISSVVKGTLGFMPPEQLFNRQLTEASDLYGLGVTLICLLTGTKSTEIGQLIDISYRVNFKPLLPKISVRWANWLEKMVEPRVKDRYPDAAAALAALPDASIYLPEVRLSESNLEFQAARSGEILTQMLTVYNPAPGIVLEGEWEVAPHTSDPPHTPATHAWIRIDPGQFTGNRTECQITVDTSKLMSNQLYNRTLALHTNSLPKTYPVSIQVRTAAIPIAGRQLPFTVLIVLLLLSLGTAWIATAMVAEAGTLAQAPTVINFGALAGAAVGLEAAAWGMNAAGRADGAIAALMAGVGLGVIAMLMALSGTLVAAGPAVVISATIGLACGCLSGIAMGFAVESLLDRGMERTFATALVLLTTTFATALGIGWKLGERGPLLTLVTVATGLAFTAVLLHFLLQRTKLQANQRQAERHLIRP